MGKFDVAPTMAAGLIRLARARAELTQAQLAAAAGLTQQSISAYETGRKDPTISTLKRLLAAAGFEMRVRLEPIDHHDTTLEAFLGTLRPEQRAQLERARDQRVRSARLERVRGR